MDSHDRQELEEVWRLALESAKRRLIEAEAQVADQIAWIAALHQQHHDTTEAEAVLAELKAELERMYEAYSQHVAAGPLPRDR